MEIKIEQLLEGAGKANGLAVIIDVFRAFTTACYAFSKGAGEIIPVGDIEKAYQLKKEYPEYILMGERNEKKPAGFDFGNSPTHLLDAGLSGKTIVHTTSSGTQGIDNAVNANEIITGSFVNAGAIARFIKARNPEKVSLVCMGYACQYPTDEDTLCAEYIKNELEGEPNNFKAIVKTIREGSGARFFEPAKQSWAPGTDFEFCMTRNRFDFVLKVQKKEGLNFLKKFEI